MTDIPPEKDTRADEWFEKTFDEFEELAIKRINEAINNEGVPAYLAALAGMSVFIGLLAKLAHHSGLEHEKLNRMIDAAVGAVKSRNAN